MKKITLLAIFLISFGAFSQTNKEKIQTYLDNNLVRFDLTSKDVSDWTIEKEVFGKGTKITSCYIAQRYQGIEIFSAQSNASIKDGRVINLGNNFIKNIDQKVNTVTPSLNVIQAITSVYAKLGITKQYTFSVVETKSKNSYMLSDGEQEDLISAKLVFQPTADKKLKLAWAFQFYTPDGNHLWDLRIDAVSGQILEQNDLKVSCNFGNHFHEKNKVGKPAFSFVENAFNNSASSMLEVNGGSYRVIPYKYESPSFSPFQLISSPEYLASSPYGWHDINGIAGAEYTITRGNNSRAYEDTDGNNTGGVSPDGGATLNFDFPYYGTSAQPSANAAVATTNIFYTTNIMHDIWYQYGFDEPSANFQQKNYTNTGAITASGDYVFAESQDGYGSSNPDLNNANFFTPADGVRPRMQMYLWDWNANIVNYVTVNSPSSVAGAEEAVTNNFEGTDRVLLPTAPGGITADLVLYKTGTSNTACLAPTNAAAMVGKIVLVKRGTCEVNVKVKNAQDAGAIAVIIMDDVAPTFPNYGNIPYGSTGLLGITIPAISVKKALGDSWISKLNLGNVINMTLATPAGNPPYLFADSDFDNGIIAHEYGHGISNRLIGGGTAGCMTNAEQMGEGWSDWFALMLQLKAGDTGADAKPMGTYVTNEPATGNGIRSVPYSTNMTICPLTLVNSNNTESHYRGETWAAVLWDLTWAYIDKYGFDPDFYAGTGGNNKVMQLVIDALKLQPCNTATFISGRDNIIAADQATTGGADYCLITEVFRRRGMGLNASSGASTNATDQTQNFTAFPAGPNCTFLAVDYFKNEEMFRVYPNPSNGQINIRINQFIGKLNIEVVDMNGRIVYNTTDIDFDIEKTINLNNLQKGVYILKASNENMNFTEKIIIK